MKTTSKTKLVKVSQFNDGTRYYTYGDWSIKVYVYNQHQGACGYLKMVTKRLVTKYQASNKITGASLDYMVGGIQVAVRRINKINVA